MVSYFILFSLYLSVQVLAERQKQDFHQFSRLFPNLGNNSQWLRGAWKECVIPLFPGIPEKDLPQIQPPLKQVQAYFQTKFIPVPSEQQHRNKKADSD